jgi:hypothetical protein
MTAPRRRAARVLVSCGGAAHWNSAEELVPASCGGARGTTLVAALRGGVVLQRAALRGWNCPRCATASRGSAALRAGGIVRLCRAAAPPTALCVSPVQRPRESAIRFLGRHGMPSPAD